MSVSLCVVIYIHDQESQNAFLRGGMTPLLNKWRLRGDICAFTFIRFDRRGPHVQLVLRTRTGESLRSVFVNELSAALKTLPAGTDLEEAQLRARDLDCAGKALCDLDRLEGLGENNTVHLTRITQRVPFLGVDERKSEVAWTVLDEAATWSLARVGSENLITPLLEWSDMVCARLREFDEKPALYWSFHLSTISFNKDQGDSTYGHLRKALSSAFQVLFTTGSCQTQPLSRILICELLEDTTSEERFIILRELTHLTWLQLGVPVLGQVRFVSCLLEFLSRGTK